MGWRGVDLATHAAGHVAHTAYQAGVIVKGVSDAFDGARNELGRGAVRSQAALPGPSAAPAALPAPSSSSSSSSASALPAPSGAPLAIEPPGRGTAFEHAGMNDRIRMDTNGCELTPEQTETFRAQ